MTRRDEQDDVFEEEGVTVELVQCQVEITRDPMMKPVTTVFAHEVLILQVVHGDDNIQILDETPVTVENFTVGGEYDRLRNKYEAGNTGALKEVFGSNPKRLADELGLPWHGGSGARTKAKVVQSLEIEPGDDSAVARPGDNNAKIVVKPKAEKAKAKPPTIAVAKPKPKAKVKAK